MKLYLNFERKLSEVESDTMRALVRRRGQREPLQHITGSTSFCGLEMLVNRSVLVPRPETELLAEAGWKFLNALKTQDSGLTNALDFGTGSGCVAIALAVNCPAAHVVALDASTEALAIAKQNAEHNKVSDRMEFLPGDGFAAAVGDQTFDLIISNPPYIPSAEIGTLQPEVRDFDPRTALDGGADGLDFYRQLAAEASAFLKPEGRIMLEFGDGQVDDVSQIFATQNWLVEAVREDYTRQPRILIARRG